MRQPRACAPKLRRPPTSSRNSHRIAAVVALLCLASLPLLGGEAPAPSAEAPVPKQELPKHEGRTSRPAGATKPAAKAGKVKKDANAPSHSGHEKEGAKPAHAPAAPTGKQDTEPGAAAEPPAAVGHGKAEGKAPQQPPEPTEPATPAPTEEPPARGTPGPADESGSPEQPAEAPSPAPESPPPAPAAAAKTAAAAARAQDASPATSPAPAKVNQVLAEAKAAARRESAITKLLNQLNEQAAAGTQLLGEDFAFYVVRLGRLARLDAAALKREYARAQADLESAERQRREITGLQEHGAQEIREGRILILDAEDLVQEYAQQGLQSDESYDATFLKRTAARTRAQRLSDELALGRKLEGLVLRAPASSFDTTADRKTVRTAVHDMKTALDERRALNGQLADLYAKLAALAWENGVLASDLSDELQKSIRVAETKALLYRSERTLSPDTLVRAVTTAGVAVRGVPRWLLRLPRRAVEVALGPPAERSGADLIGTYVPVLFFWVVALALFRYLGLRATFYEHRLGDVQKLDSPSRIPFLAMHTWRLSRWFGIGAATYGTVQRLHFGPAAEAFSQIAFTGWILAALVCKFARVLIAPVRSEFRVLPLTDASASYVFRLVRALAVLVVVGWSALSALEAGSYVRVDVLALLRLLLWLGGIGLIAATLYGLHGLLSALSPQAGGWQSTAWNLSAFLAHAFILSAVAVVVVHSAGYWNLARYFARCIPLNGLAVFAVWSLWRFARRHADRWQANLPAIPPRELGKCAGREAVSQLLGLAVWLVTGLGGVLLMAQVWSIRWQHVRRVITVLQHPLLTVKGAGVSSWSVLKAAVLVACFLWLASLVRRLLHSSARLERRYTEGGRYALASLSFYAILGGGFLWSLMAAGFDPSVLAVFAGMAGIGLGFGLQNIVHNFISGLILLIERPIALNDFVEVGSLRGTVSAISLRSTTVRTLSNVFVVVPNSQFVSDQVTNLSHRDTKIRLELPVGVHYGSDMAAVYAVLQRATESHPEVLKHPAPEVRMVEFGDNSVNFSLLAWIEHPHRMPFVSAQIMRTVWEALKENGIEIPYPQRDLHLRSVDADAARQLRER